MTDKPTEDKTKMDTEEKVEKKEEKKDVPRQKKKSANRLIVDDVAEVVAQEGDNSCILLSNEKMEGKQLIQVWCTSPHKLIFWELSLFRGDSVLVRGKRRRETVCIAIANDNTDNTKVRMNKVIRKNLKVKLGDCVSIHSAGEIKYGTRIHVLAFADTVEGITGNLFDTYLKPYFADSYRPVKKDDCFLVRAGFRPVEFKVIFF